MQNLEKENREHSLYMNNRREISFTGVRDILSFDEESVNLITAMGNVAIKGKSIKIGSFNTDTGDMQMEGRFNAIVYLDDSSTKQNFFKRLWR
ncbi:MAG: sporulation protein YabP [Ruminococcaceae bacterium]|nr:sporulation protein YabP [Oscillospiraceae bacterium]